MPCSELRLTSVHATDPLHSSIEADGPQDGGGRGERAPSEMAPRRPTEPQLPGVSYTGDVSPGAAPYGDQSASADSRGETTGFQAINNPNRRRLSEIVSQGFEEGQTAEDSSLGGTEEGSEVPRVDMTLRQATSQSGGRVSGRSPVGPLHFLPSSDTNLCEKRNRLKSLNADQHS